MKNITLLIDGNYHFHKSLGVFQASNKGKFMEKDEDRINLIDKYATDLLYIIKQFSPYVESVIFAKDSYSWRKDFYPPYKENRKTKRDTQKETINWTKYFEANTEFLEIIKNNNNITISEIRGAEADDLICLWSKYLNSKNKNCVIISGDGDLKQLLSCNEKTNTFTIQYNPNTRVKSLFVPNNFLTWKKNYLANEKLSETVKSKSNDIFSVSNPLNTKSLLSFITELEKTIPTKLVIADEILLEKVLMGDKKDNVPALIDTTIQGKKVKITPKLYETMYNNIIKNWDEIIFSDLKTSKPFINIIKKTLEDKFKVELELSELNENFNRNARLLELIEDNIPNNVVSLFNTQTEDLIKYKSIPNKTSLFENTRYETVIENKSKRVGTLMSSLF